MDLHKKFIAGAVMAAVTITSSGAAFADDRGRGHSHRQNHSHGQSHNHGKDSDKDIGKIAGAILGIALIGSLIASANSEPQPSYAPPTSYAPGPVTYSYTEPAVHTERRVVYVEESPRHYRRHGYGRHHHRHHGYRDEWHND